MMTTWVKKLAVALWIAGILFPFGWLTYYSEGYRYVFDAIFAPQWMHVAMHTMLYAVLAFLLGGLWSRGWTGKARWHRYGLLLSMVLAVAVGQEGLQLLYQRRMPGSDELFDLAVDLGGGVIGLLTLHLWGKMRAITALRPRAHHPGDRHS